MKNKFWLGIGFLAAAVLMSSGVAVAQNRSNAAAQTAVALKTLDGATVSLAALKNQPTVLAVGATWLPLSREQAAIVNQLQQTFGKRGVSVIFISTDSADAKSKNFADDAAVKQFAERSKIAVQVLRDPNGTTLKAFNLDQIPAFVILNKSGEVAATIVGLDVEDNAAAIAQISAEIEKTL